MRLQYKKKEKMPNVNFRGSSPRVTCKRQQKTKNELETNKQIHEESNQYP